MLSSLLPALLLSTAMQQSTDWPYPEDAPSPEPASVGLAGAEEVNVARYFKVAGASGARISPDGETVIYRSSLTGEPQVFAVPFEGGQPKLLTYGTGVSTFGFAPDGRILIAADTDGNERVGFTLLTDDGLQEQRILEASEAFNSFGSFDEETERFVFANTSRTGDDYDIYLKQIGEGEAERIYEGKFGFYPASFRPDSDDILVTETRGEDGNALHVLDVTTGELTTLFDEEETAAYDNLTFAPDGTGFFLTTNHEREFTALAFFDLEAFENGTEPEDALRIIHAPEGRDVDGLALAAERYLVFTENADGYSQIGGFDLDRRMRPLRFEELPRGVYGISAAEDAPRIAVTVNGPKTPGTVIAVDLSRQPATTDTIVEPHTAGLDVAGFAEPESVRFAARDGTGLQGLLYRPDETSGDVPVLITVHGGPTAQARPYFDPLAEYLRSQGIAVLDLNFRGSTGFGKTFARMDNQRNRTKAVDDVADAVAWLQEQEGLDGDRVAVMGGSYGGYLTNAAVGAYPELFEAGVSLVGVSDWVRALEEASPALKASDVIEYGDITDAEEREFFASISPINNVDEIEAAMLFSHGVNDPRDPVTESDRMVRALRERELEVTYLRWPDEGHSVRKLDNRVHLYREIAAFLEEELKAE
jgi:dipeptidyl aminopeptidase/acylaminoacyl peptidase